MIAFVVVFMISEFVGLTLDWFDLWSESLYLSVWGLGFKFLWLCLLTVVLCTVCLFVGFYLGCLLLVSLLLV